MVEILPVRDKILQESACLHCGIKYAPELMAYAAYSNGKLSGICQFSVNSGYASIVDLKIANNTNDNQLSIIIGCAVLNFIDFCGVSLAKCESKSISEDVLISIGFSKNSDGIYEIDIPHYINR